MRIGISIYRYKTRKDHNYAHDIINVGNLPILSSLFLNQTTVGAFTADDLKKYLTKVEID